jgi:hypothetical protein
MEMYENWYLPVFNSSSIVWLVVLSLLVLDMIGGERKEGGYFFCGYLKVLFSKKTYFFQFFFLVFLPSNTGYSFIYLFLATSPSHKDMDQSTCLFA